MISWHWQGRCYAYLCREKYSRALLRLFTLREAFYLRRGRSCVNLPIRYRKLPHCAGKQGSCRNNYCVWRHRSLALYWLTSLFIVEFKLFPEFSPVCLDLRPVWIFMLIAAAQSHIRLLLIMLHWRNESSCYLPRSLVLRTPSIALLSPLLCIALSTVSCFCFSKLVLQLRLTSKFCPPAVYNNYSPASFACYCTGKAVGLIH